MLQRELEVATGERDRAILDAYYSFGRVLQIAEAAGVSRQTVYTIINAAEGGAG